MIPSPLVRAAQDAHVRGSTLAVYVLLFEYLSAFEPRPAKLLPLSRSLGIKKPAVSKAIRVLLDRGYLSRGPDVGVMHTYRLEFSPKVSPQETIRAA